VSTSIFTDKSTRPNEADIKTALGAATVRWRSLVEHIRSTYAVGEEVRFLYGQKHGWGLQFRSRGKSFAALFPNDRYFVVLIILGVDELREAGSLGLHNNACEAMEAANLYAEGKWLFITVRNHHDLNDVKNLLKIKAHR